MKHSGEDEPDEESVVETELLEREIRERAYDLFLQRAAAGGEGDEAADWLAAEAEVLERRGLRDQ
jgi:hypothetical protein